MTVRVRPLLPLWAALLTSAVAGLVLDAAFPDTGWWPLAFLAVAFALVSLVGRRAWSAALVGFAFGLTFYLVNVEFTARWVGPLPWVALAVLESVFVAVGAVLITLAYRWMPRVAPRRWQRLVLLPALVAGLWVTRESVVGSFPYGGFPWGRIGTSQVNGPLAEVVSWTGTLGLSFLVVAVVAAAIEIVRTAAWGAAMPRGLVRRAAAPVALAAVLVALIVLPAWQTTATGTMRVASVQGNGPAGYFDVRRQGDMIAAQAAATAPLLGEDGVDLVVWPEGAVDLDPTRSAAAAAMLNGISEGFDAPLLTNQVRTDGQQAFNSSYLWRAGEGMTQIYDKRNLVPFGEYVPDRAFYRSIAPSLIDMIARDYTRGTNSPVFDIDGVPAGLGICFDVIYDDLVWQGAREGAEVYLFQTNNADFRGTDENLQQLAFARLRAIETGRSVVNISTVGTSQVIAPDGSTIDSLPANEPGAMLTDVELRTGSTPAVLLGGGIEAVISWGSVIALSFVGAIALTARRRDEPTA